MSTSEILQLIDWPEDVLLLDFETYFADDYTLSKSSIVEYICDPRFEFTGLGIQINDSKPVFVGGPDVPWVIGRLKKKFGKALHNCTVVAKNNKFDVGILAMKFGIFPPYTIDVEDLTRYYDSRMSQKLKDVAEVFGLPPKGETVQFKNMTWDQLDQVAMKQYCLRDIEDEKALLDILLPIIDNPRNELALAHHTLDLYLKPVLKLDLDQARQIRDGMDGALQDDLDKVSWVLDYATKDKKTIEKILRAKKLFPQILQDVLPDGEEVPMKKGKNEMIPATAKQDEEFQLLLAHSDEKVRNLCAAKAACTAWPLHRNKVEHMINQANCSGGKMRIPLKYYGAHTGRWSGTEKWNPLNLGGKGRGVEIHPLISSVRGTIVAPDGYEFAIADSAQIEARELAWISGQNDLLKGFADGKDVYSLFATRLFGEEVRKPITSDSERDSAILTIRRGFGKDAILGCGYGMGADTFYTRCRQNKSLRPMFDSGEYDLPFIKKLIDTYRKSYKQITKFWDTIESCFRFVTKYPHEVKSYYIDDPGISLHGYSDGVKPIIKNALLTFWVEGSTTVIQLPSGRRLFYPHAKVSAKRGDISYQHGKLYGGKLTENVVQAICRDLLVYWILKCEEVGIEVKLHSYDEIVAIVPESKKESKLQEMIDIMSIGPDWVAGLPLAAEGQTSRKYCK